MPFEIPEDLIVLGVYDGKFLVPWEGHESSKEFVERLGTEAQSTLKRIYRVMLHNAISECEVPIKTSFVVNPEPDLYSKIDQYLDNSDFYTAPASTKFHEAFECGLVVHSLTVASRITELLELSRFKCHVSRAHAVLAALTHDWCKIHLYESYQKNTKDATGKWVQETAYRWSEDRPLGFGHGASSAMILRDLYPGVPKDVLLAVRWHMGAWDCSNNDMSDLGRCNESVPLVLLLQFADQLSTAEF